MSKKIQYINEVLKKRDSLHLNELEKFDSSEIGLVLASNLTVVMKHWIKFQQEWINTNYKVFRDHDKYMLLIYLVSKSWDDNLNLFKIYSIEEYYSKNDISLPSISLHELSVNLKIPKETIRRKLIELEKDNIITRKGQKIILSMSNQVANSKQLFKGCPGTHLSFSKGDELTVKKVEGAFFTTTSWGTLWAPIKCVTGWESGYGGEQRQRGGRVSKHHTGMMRCGCIHESGDELFPLDPSRFHLANTCKWLCCGENWDNVKCKKAVSRRKGKKKKKGKGKNKGRTPLSYVHRVCRKQERRGGDVHTMQRDPKRTNYCDVCGMIGTTYRCDSGCDWDVCKSCWEVLRADVNDESNEHLSVDGAELHCGDKCVVSNSGKVYSSSSDLAERLGVSGQWENGNSEASNGQSCVVVAVGKNPHDESVTCCAVKMDTGKKQIILINCSGLRLVEAAADEEEE